MGKAVGERGPLRQPYHRQVLQPPEPDASGQVWRIRHLQAVSAGGRARSQGRKGPYGRVLEMGGEEDEETGEIKEVPFLRYYSVFHIDQCEGLTAKYENPLPLSASADETAEAIISAYCQREGVSLTHTAGESAFYRPSTDAITLPKRSQFTATAEYYSTAFHELTHSTGHSKRLNRLSETAFFGSEAYSKEELIAEIGAAALVNHVGLETSHSLRNSAAYIQNWLAVLKNDKRFIVSASGKADKAISLILGC